MSASAIPLKGSLDGMVCSDDGAGVLVECPGEYIRLRLIDPMEITDGRELSFTWIDLTPDQARELAARLLKAAG